MRPLLFIMSHAGGGFLLALLQLRSKPITNLHYKVQARNQVVELNSFSFFSPGLLTVTAFDNHSFDLLQSTSIPRIL